jgi:hypothetical protein
VDLALAAGLAIKAQAAGSIVWKARGAAVAGEVALHEDLDEGVLAVAALLYFHNLLASSVP